MKKKVEEDLSMFDDAKQFVSLLIPMTFNSQPSIQKKMIQNKPKFVYYINKEHLKKFCVEQGLNLDPSSTDKAKKELEINDEIMALTFKTYLIEENLNQKREKKAVQDAQNKDSKKKDTKKVDVPVTQVTEEKQYNKNFDQLFIFQDYPQTQQDFIQLSKLGIKIDMVIKLVENLDNYNILEQQNNDDDDEQQQVKEPQIVFLNNQTVKILRQYQQNSKRGDHIRDIKIHEIGFDENQEDFCDQLCEEISAFSLEKEAYYQWLKSKQEISLERQEKQYDIQSQILLIQQSQEKERNADLENEERQKQFVKKKKTDQDILDDETYQKLKDQEQALRETLQQEIDDIIKKEKENFLKTFNIQMNALKDENQTCGVILECLIDEIRSEKKNQNNQSQKEKNDDNDIQQFLEKQNQEFQKQSQNNQLFNQKPLNTVQEKQILLNYLDTINRKSLNSKLQSGDLVSDREKKITENIQYPGVKRNVMPQIPEISEKLQNLNLCENLVFQENNTLYQIQNNLDLFQKMCQQQLNIKYDFSDRLYVERLDQNLLKQTLYNSFLQEKQIISQYNIEDDSLFLLLVDKIVQGRIRRQKQQMDWKVLPNLENYLKLFKNSQQQTFYDFDYTYLGDISQKTKHIMPSNNGIIKVQTNKIGNQVDKRFRLIKENVSLNVDVNRFNSLFQNGTRIFCQKQDDIVSTTITLKNGLMIQLLPNNEILQSYQNSSQIIDEKQRMVLSKGSVIKYMNNGQTIILFANGNVAVKDAYSDVYVTTNNKGLRSLQQQSQLNDIPCVKRRDYDYTDSEVLLREDNVQVVWYKCGTMYTLHSDGTKILTETDGTIIVEHPDYSTVKIQEEKSVVYFFDETEAILEFDTQTIYHQDKTQIAINPDGNLNLFFSDETQYAINLNEGYFEHEDQQGNQFKISNYDQECQILSSKQIQFETQDQQESANSSENEYLPEYLKDKDIEIDQYYQPQLIVIKGDQAIQYLSEYQLSTFFQNYQEVQQIDRQNFIEKIFLIQDIPFQRIKKFDLDSPPMINETQKDKSLGNTTLVRNIYQYKNIDFNKFNASKLQYDSWKISNQRGLVEWGYKTQRNKEEKIQEKDIFQQIIKFRQNDFTEERYQKFIDSENFQQIFKKFIDQFIEKSNQKKPSLQKKLYIRDPINVKRLLSKSKLNKKLDLKKYQKKNTFDINVPQQFIECYFKTYYGLQALEKMPAIPPPNKQKRIIIQPKTTERTDEVFEQNLDDEIQQKNTPQDTRIKQKTLKQIYKPSVFQIEEEEIEKLERNQKLQSEHYYAQKRQDFNIYGQKREKKQQVPCLLRTTPDTKDSNWDNRCKISSMNNRLHMKAQNIQQKRKQGPHQTLQDLQDKKNTVLSLIEKDNMGLINDIHDNLKRNVLINPIQARFGFLQSGKLYQMKITVKNEDVMAQRITVKPCQTKYSKAFQAELGPIALGMTRDIIIHLDASQDIQGIFEDKFEIITKSEIFNIPISAQILEPYEYMEKDQQNLLHKNKQLLKPNVQEVSKEKSEMKFLDSTTSDNKLPKIQQFDKNTKIEYKNLDNIISIIDN